MSNVRSDVRKLMIMLPVETPVLRLNGLAASLVGQQGVLLGPVTAANPGVWAIGSDEAGYGTWAGDLCVAAVAVPQGWSDPKVTDSKKMSDTTRDAVVALYKGKIPWAIHRTSPAQIDALGVFKALLHAHREVHQALYEKVMASPGVSVASRVVDGLENARKALPGLTPMNKADLKVPAVSLASCFAKVLQCLLMDLAEQQYPGYAFGRHRGYGTPQHLAALNRQGVCPIHRKSYGPVKAILGV